MYSSHLRRLHRRLSLLSRPPLARHRPNRRQAALEQPKGQILQRRRLEQATRSSPSSPVLTLHRPSKIAPEWGQQRRAWRRTQSQRNARQNQPLPGTRDLARRHRRRLLRSPRQLIIRRPNRVGASKLSPLRHDLQPRLHSLNNQQLEPDRLPLRTPNRPGLLRLMQAPNLEDQLTRGLRPFQHSQQTAF